VAARLWTLAKGSYFDGMNAVELADLLDALDANLQVSYVSGSHRICQEFTLQQCNSGCLVITSWKSRTDHHWVLVVGIEGMQHERQFVPHAFLCIDPGTVPQPLMSGSNARLKFECTSTKTRPMQYLSADGLNTAVRLTSAVAIGDKR
jgi:hypothetical protein